MLKLHLDRKIKLPLYKQIINQIISSIESGELKDMEKLPSSRVLAELYNLNRTTVSRAYQELWGLGYLESRPGSYSRVRTKKSTIKKRNNRDNVIDWNHLGQISLLKNKKHSTKKASRYDFRLISPDPELVPGEKIRRCFNTVLKEQNILGYSEPKGYLPLRDFIAEHLRNHSIDSSTDEIFISNGSQNSLDLICKFFARKSWTVLVERPTYSLMIPLLEMYGAHIIDITFTEDGLDLDDLENKIETYSPAFIYVMSNFHNPTGLTSSPTNRESLLSICSKSKTPIVEDGFTEDLRGVILPIKSMGDSSIVIYLGTFSKLLFPGLRIGWISAPSEFLDRITEIQYISNISGNLPTQAAVNLFCRKGYHHYYINKIQSIYKRRMKLAIETLNEFLPKEVVHFTKPKGGFLIWLTISDPKYSESELLEILQDREIFLTRGSSHFISKSDQINFRLSISQVDEKDIRDGLIELCEVLKKLYI